MAYNVVLALFFIVICNNDYTLGAFIETTRYDLIHYLLDKDRYDATLPPNFYSDNATDVTVQVSIYDLNSQKNLDMEYECTLYLRMYWADHRLDFTANRTSYDTLKVSGIKTGQVWIPDLYFHHERHAEFHGLMKSNQLIYIHRNGSVQFSGRVNIKSHCRMDLKKYPYDEQICHITIQSYAYTAEDIILHWGNPPIRVTTDNMETVPDSSASTFSSPYDDPVGNFSTLNGDVKLTRESQSYEVMYIAPPAILSIVSLTSFLLADDSFACVTIATSSLTGLVMQWAGIYSKLPPVSKLYILDWWMLTNMLFIALVVIANVVRYRRKHYSKIRKGSYMNIDEIDNIEKKRKPCRFIKGICKPFQWIKAKCEPYQCIEPERKECCCRFCVICFWHLTCGGEIWAVFLAAYVSTTCLFIHFAWKKINE